MRYWRAGESIDVPNVWMGVSVENKQCKARIDALRSTGARIKFLSLEPLLGPLGRLDLTGIDWVIVGGESGPGARPMREEWVVEIQEQCASTEVPFFFKQWGGVRKKQNGRRLLGRTWDEVPSTSLSLARAARGDCEEVWGGREEGQEPVPAVPSPRWRAVR